MKDGYTRVSDILSQWNRFAHIPKHIVARKAELGTKVHEYIQMWACDAFFASDDEVMGYLNSYIAWEKMVHPKMVRMEERYYCDELMITGQCDAVVQFPYSDELVIIDYKTSASIDDKFWRMQGAFYHYLVSNSGLKISPRYLFLQLDKNGKMPKVREYEFSEKMWGYCMAALTSYRYLN